MKDFHRAIGLLNDKNIKYKILTYENYLDILINENLHITFNIDNNCNAIFYNEGTYNIHDLYDILNL